MTCCLPIITGEKEESAASCCRTHDVKLQHLGRAMHRRPVITGAHLFTVSEEDNIIEVLQHMALKGSERREEVCRFLIQPIVSARWDMKSFVCLIHLIDTSLC